MNTLEENPTDLTQSHWQTLSYKVISSTPQSNEKNMCASANLLEQSNRVGRVGKTLYFKFRLIRLYRTRIWLYQCLSKNANKNNRIGTKN